MGICSVCIIAQSIRWSVEMQVALTLPVTMLGWKTSTKFAAGKYEGCVSPLSPFHLCIAQCHLGLFTAEKPPLQQSEQGKRGKDLCLVSQLQLPVVICCILSSDSKCSPLIPCLYCSEHKQDQQAPQQRDQTLCSVRMGLCVQSWGRILSHNRCDAAFSKAKHSSWM